VLIVLCVQAIMLNAVAVMPSWNAANNTVIATNPTDNRVIVAGTYAVSFFFINTA
jgi:hypothetical protein